MSLLNASGDPKGRTEIPKTKLLFPTQAVANKFLSGRILAPLRNDMGVIFDYSPNIVMSVASAYQPMDLPHTNYDFHSFNKSSIQDITLDFDLTAHTKEEADRTLAIIHFFRTFTKMAYGVNDPNRGMPPQIFRFSAYGEYMINRAPVAIKNFNLNLANDVDYVMTSSGTAVPVHSKFTAVLVYMPTPNKIRSDFTLDSFANGTGIQKGYI